MAVTFANVKAVVIPQGEVKQIADSTGNILWQKITRVDLTALCTNAGWRNTSNQISGDGTDPNWQYSKPVAIDGQTKITCSIDGYTTIASIMFYRANMSILSYIKYTGGGVGRLNLTDDPIPGEAAYVAITCHNQSKWTGQFCYME